MDGFQRPPFSLVRVLTLSVYSALGQLIADLVNGDLKSVYREMKSDGSNL